VRSLNNTVLIRYVTARSLSATAVQMQAVALAWIIYERTGSAFNLGLIGLFSFLPAVLLMLPAGLSADRFDRRRVVQLALLSQAAGSVALFVCVRWGASFFLPLAYLLAAAAGAARAFSQPAFQSLLPDIVEPADLSQAVAASSSSNQAATIAGPAIGGLIMAWAGGGVFLVLAALYLIASAVLLGLRLKRSPLPRKAGPPPSPWAGLAYVKTNRVLLGAISLDMFTVLLGGVTAILPIFARDILHVGPVGLGLLRSGPAIGALVVGLSLIYMPIRRHTGVILLGAVAGYGVATVLFGLSIDFRLSMVAMIALGGFDMVSVVIRQTLVQVATPDAMRGRVSAVNGVFVGASNQLGGFESGLVASWIGAAPSAVAGGVGALLVVLSAAVLFPEIRRADRLDDLAPTEKETEAAVRAVDA
jgi:MFS family permease